MKKRWIAVLIALNMALVPAGCGTAQTQDNAGADAAADTSGDEAGEEENGISEEDAGAGSAEEAGDDRETGAAAGVDEVLGDMTIDYSEAVAAVISRSWNVEGEEETYMFSPDGSGEHGLNGEKEAFRYTCGFDEENNILVQIMTGDSEETYQISTDETGYGLYMEAAPKGGEKKLLLPAGLKILDTDDERVSDILGIWKDDSGNRYEFTEDGRFRILTSENNDGTFSAAEKEEEEVQEICILVAGGTLKYEYRLQDEGKTLELYSRDAESFYYWHREE